MLSAPLIILSISARARVFTAGRLSPQGSLEDIIGTPDSLTGKFLSGERRISIPEKRNVADPAKMLTITGACGNNLKNVTLNLPVGLFNLYHRGFPVQGNPP
ncbi:Excinuclease ABC subunit A [Morganella morganii]|nr:Excinuclease ABC subunit A [Morganella morganii]